MNAELLEKLSHSPYVEVRESVAGNVHTSPETPEVLLKDKDFPLCMECEFVEYQDDETGLGVIGKVINTSADETVMNEDKVDISKVSAIAFDPYTHGYYEVTKRVGEAFSDGLKLKA